MHHEMNSGMDHSNMNMDTDMNSGMDSDMGQSNMTMGHGVR